MVDEGADRIERLLTSVATLRFGQVRFDIFTPAGAGRTVRATRNKDKDNIGWLLDVSERSRRVGVHYRGDILTNGASSL